MALAGLSAGAPGLSNPSTYTMRDIRLSKPEPGFPMREEGDFIVDSNGRRYTRDAKGTIRRVK